MSYYIVDYVPLDNGWSPAVPEGAEFLLLAYPSNEPPRWGIFFCRDELQTSRFLRPVDRRLSELIASGERYPPALALAREESFAQSQKRLPTREEFCSSYGSAIKRHLESQQSAPYLLAEAVRSEPGYLVAGQFYWVLRYLRGSSVVQWVSSDYFVYQNPFSDFALSRDQLARLLLRPSNAV